MGLRRLLPVFPAASILNHLAAITGSHRLNGWRSRSRETGAATRVGNTGLPSSPDIPFDAKFVAVVLGQNFPNPFNPRTSIAYTVSEQAHVSIEIFDASGALVTRLNEGERRAGTQWAVWDGRDRAGRPVPSGVYFYRLAGIRDLTPRKMVLIR